MRYAALVPTLAACALLAQEGAWTFDGGDSGWAVWGVDDGAAHAQAVQLDGGALRISDQDAAVNPYAAADPARPTAGVARWKLTLRLRAARADQPPAAVAVAAEGGGRWLGWLGRTAVMPATAWTTVSLVIDQLPPGTTHLRPSVFPVGEAPPSATATVWIDDAVLAPLDPPAAAAPAQALDLRPLMNRALRDDQEGDGLGGWTDQGDNDLRGLAPGPITVGGLGFTVGDPAANGGKGVVAISAGRSGFAGRAQIAVGRACDRLDLLHCAAWASAGKAVGTVEWRYADGSSATSRLTAGLEVGDWWSGFAERAARLELPAEANPRHSPVYLFATPLANPHPQRPVATVELVGAAAPAGGAPPIWLVLAAATAMGEAPLATAALARRDLSGWAPFAPRPSATAQPLLDLSGLLDAPAGKHGPVRRVGGRLEFADGTRARFCGVNIHANRGALPERDEAERVATTLARYGINLVRLHLLEGVLLTKEGGLDAGNLARVDWLVACLQKRGIYILLDSVTGLSARTFRPADGVEDGYGAHRPWAYYHPRLEALARSYAEALLSHVNPHTGLSYAKDPGVAATMLINEQSTFFDWMTARGNAMPATVRALLEQRFAAFLRERHRDRAGLAAAWGDELRPGEDPATAIAPAPLPGLPPAAGMAGPGGPKRTRDTVDFLAAMQESHDRAMREHLRGLGLQIPIAGTNIVGSPAELAAQRQHDFTSHNAYYDHVHFSADQRTMRCDNRPLVALDPLVAGQRSIETALAAARLAGAPFISTESTINWPHEWRSTYGLALAATTALQDWDGLLQYAYLGGWGYSVAQSTAAPGVTQPTVACNDPAIVALYPAMALMVLRGDVAPARARVQVVYRPEEASSTRPFTAQSGHPFSYLAWVSRAESAFGTAVGAPAATIGHGPGAIPWSDRDGPGPLQALALDRALKAAGVVPADRGLQDGRLVSDTGEVVRDWKRGLITVDTARTQGFSGFAQEPVRLRDCTIACPGFATVVVSALDGDGVRGARRLLITAVGRAENEKGTVSFGEAVTGSDGKPRGEAMTLHRDPGDTGRVLIEPVRARLTLPLAAATITAVGPDLAALGEPRPCPAAGDGTVTAELTGPASVWYLVEAGGR